MNQPNEPWMRFSVQKRIQLVNDIWDSIAEDQKAANLTPELRQELNRRIEAHRANPDRASTWEEVKSQIQKPQ